MTLLLLALLPIVVVVYADGGVISVPGT